MRSGGELLAGRYRVVRRLGTGGTASVLLAEDELLGRNVAVKVLHPSAESSTGRRIQREARLGATLSHPNLVTVFDVVVEDDVLLLVMEHVPGETLAERLDRGPLEPGEAVAILRQIADALDHVHARGVVHRDVKPGNVLIRSGTGRQVKLADLGIAAAEDVSQITQAGTVLGTLAYVAPEQLEGHPATPAADVYALAAVAYETLCGERARRGSTSVELVAAATNAPPPDLEAVRPDLPAAAGEILRRGMAADPAERPLLARALVDELEAALRPAIAAVPEPAPADPPAPSRRATPLPAPPPTAPSAAVAPPGPARPRRRRAALLAPLALVAIAVAVALAVLAGSGSDEPADRQAGRTTTTQDGGATTGDAPATTEQERPQTQEQDEPPATTATEEEEPAPDTADGAGGSPDDAVRALYERAAADDLDAAWALATPGLRAQLGPRSTFDATFATLESIEFGALDVTDRSGDAATVALQTVATHTTFTDRCTGTAQTTRSDGGRWRVERLSVQCARV